MNFVALFEQQAGEIATILPRHAADQSLLHGLLHICRSASSWTRTKNPLIKSRWAHRFLSKNNLFCDTAHLLRTFAVSKYTRQGEFGGNWVAGPSQVASATFAAVASVRSRLPATNGSSCPGRDASLLGDRIFAPGGAKPEGRRVHSRPAMYGRQPLRLVSRLLSRVPATSSTFPSLAICGSGRSPRRGAVVAFHGRSVRSPIPLDVPRL